MGFVPWNSQPLDEWAEKHAPGSFIDLDGHLTHYIEKGEGSPVILLHGFFYDTFMWHNNIEALAAYHKVYAMDLWGFGYSTREPMDYGYSLYTRQLRLFMDAMGIRKATLIGQSMGGGTIIKFAVSHRDRINKVILVCPAGMTHPLPWIARITTWPVIGEFMDRLNVDFLRKLALKMNFIHDPGHITPAYFENATRFHKIKGTSESMLTILRKQFFDKLIVDIHAYGQLNIPTLIVWGRQDRAIPVSRGREMQKIMQGSRLEIIDHAGHCPHDEQSKIFNRLAIDFLQSADS